MPQSELDTVLSSGERRAIDSAELFASLFPHQYSIRVAWGDMDAYQHVNNVQYFRYFESSRVDFFDTIGDESLLDTGSEDAANPVLAGIACRFQSAILYPDTILVGTRILQCTDAFLQLDHTVWSAQQNRIVAVGTADVAFFNFATNARASMPKALFDALGTYAQSQADATVRFRATLD